MAARILSALVALPLALFLIHSGGWPFYILVFFVTGMALFEWMSMTDPGHPAQQGTLTALGMVVTWLVMAGQLTTPAGIATATAAPAIRSAK